VIAGCGAVMLDEAATTATTPAPARPAPPTPARLHGEAARAAAAVRTLGRALDEGDVEALCRPGAVFAPAVVAAMNAGDASCEATDEVPGIVRRPPALTIVGMALRPDVATAQV
jgi:hypothetical protein